MSFHTCLRRVVEIGDVNVASSLDLLLLTRLLFVSHHVRCFVKIPEIMPKVFKSSGERVFLEGKGGGHLGFEKGHTKVLYWPSLGEITFLNKG